MVWWNSKKKNPLIAMVEALVVSRCFPKAKVVQFYSTREKER